MPAINSMLHFSQQRRQDHRTHPPLHWDMKQSPSHAHPASDPHHHISPSSLAQAATSPPTPALRITSGLFPYEFAWHIDVRNPRGVTVGDVLAALYNGLRRGVTQHEWARTSHTQKARVADAFYSRTRRSSDPRWEHSQGVRRIDCLLKHTAFVGLSPSAESPYTWILTTKRVDS